MQKEDATLLYIWENDESVHEYNEHYEEVSLQDIMDFIDECNSDSPKDYLRLIIVKKEDNSPLGTIDLFEINKRHKRAGIGILIASSSERRKGYGKEVVQLIEKFAKEELELTQIHSMIREDNQRSIQFFEKLGYLRTGTKKKWLSLEDKDYDAYFYQKFLR